MWIQVTMQHLMVSDFERKYYFSICCNYNHVRLDCVGVTVCVRVCDRVYRGAETLKMKQTKSTYGDRIGCGIKKDQETDDNNKLLVYFNKNGTTVTLVTIYDIL